MKFDPRVECGGLERYKDVADEPLARARAEERMKTYVPEEYRHKLVWFCLQPNPASPFGISGTVGWRYRP